MRRITVLVLALALSREIKVEPIHWTDYSSLMNESIQMLIMSWIITGSKRMITEDLVVSCVACLFESGPPKLIFHIVCNVGEG